MITDSTIEMLEKLGNKYQEKGYDKQFILDDKTHKYELRLAKEDKVIVVRDGYYNGEFTKGEASITSFDVLLTLDKKIFAQYFSDYPLEEYELRLEEAQKLIDAFDAEEYDVVSERSFFGKKKIYLNITVDGEVEHLLGREL